MTASGQTRPGRASRKSGYGRYASKAEVKFQSIGGCRYGTLRTTPAVALGIADHVWSIGELIGAAFTSEFLPCRPRSPLEGKLLRGCGYC